MRRLSRRASGQLRRGVRWRSTATAGGDRVFAPHDLHRASVRVLSSRYQRATRPEELRSNMHANAIPESIRTTTAESYAAFLKERRSLMAKVIRDYYLDL